MEGKKIRVLIVEDTLVGQGLLKGLLSEDPRFEIIGIVGNGRQAIEFIAGNRPDVISMDIYMPVMDGIEATRIIMRESPVPIAIVSSFYSPAEVQMSFRILEAGALTILQRPFGPGHPQFAETARNYRNTLKMISEINVGTVMTRSKPKFKGQDVTHVSKELSANASLKRNSIVPGEKCEVIAIGASAGGPMVIRSILNGLPKSLKVPVMIVQHIDKNFAEGFVDWLSLESNIPVNLARNYEQMLPGNAYLPPGDHHLGLLSKGVISVSKNLAENGLRPAVSFLFRSILSHYGKNSVAILLSGMGVDGAAEMKQLFDTGAFTIAQDASSALVHGMPGEAIRIGGASMVLSHNEIVKEIQKHFKL